MTDEEIKAQFKKHCFITRAGNHIRLDFYGELPTVSLSSLTELARLSGAVDILVEFEAGNDWGGQTGKDDDVLILRLIMGELA